jgi:hypothetical protein
VEEGYKRKTPLPDEQKEVLGINTNHPPSIPEEDPAVNSQASISWLADDPTRRAFSAFLPMASCDFCPRLQ